MKKRLQKAVTMAMSGLMAAALVFGVSPMKAEAAGNRLVVPKFETAPVLDGTISDGEWGDVAFVVKDGEENINTLDEGGVFPADFNADIYLGYDSTHIYIAAKAEYDVHKNEALLPSDLWAGDCVQIQISDTVGANRNELGFAQNSLTNKNQAVAWASTGSFTMEGEGVDYIVLRDGTTTVYEIALGVEQFSSSLTELADGMTLPFSLSFHMSGGGFLEYCAGIVQAKDINQAALIGLGAEPDENAAPVVDLNAVNVNDTLLDTRTEIGNRDVPGILEAEDYDELYGTEIHINEECPDGNGGNLGWTSDRDYIVYKNVNFASVPTGVNFRTSGTGEPTVQIRLDAVDGTKIAELKLTATGEWDTYGTSSAELINTDDIVGTHDVYVLINGGMNLNYIEFTGEGAPAQEKSEPVEESAAPEEESTESIESAASKESHEASAPAEESGSSSTAVVIVVVIVIVAIVVVAAVVMSKKKKGASDDK